MRECVFAIACGYPDGNDLDALRADAAFKLACGRLPDRGADLASQPPLSRLENTPDLRALIRLSHEMVDLKDGPSGVLGVVEFHTHSTLAALRRDAGCSGE